MSDPFSPVSPPSTDQLRARSRRQLLRRHPSRKPSIKFKSCRWRRPPEDGPECCGHRDVLPIAGTSFNPEAWCPDCAFFKLRRTPKKRSPDDYRY